MLIDNEPMIASLSKKMLERLGYEVIDFIDSVEALKLFSEHPKDFDLVITDYGMEKMNGKKLAEKLTEIRRGIPIILCTGYGNLRNKEEIYNWGINNLLMKPFILKDLNEVLRRVLGNKSEEKN